MLNEHEVKAVVSHSILSFDSVFDAKDLIGQAWKLCGRRGRGCEVCVGGGD